MTARTSTMIDIRPLPGAAFDTVPATPELDAYLSRCTDGTPVVVIWHGRFRRPTGQPVPILVTGAVFERRIYGEAAEIASDLVALAAAGMPEATAHAEPLLDLALPARLTDPEPEPAAASHEVPA